MMKNLNKTWLLALSGIFISLIFCGKDNQAELKKEQKTAIVQELKMKNIEITSPAFAEGDTIPVKFTCDGSDVSPELTWSAPPEGTKSLALICDDPDAPRGTWVHWVLFNIPPIVVGLSEAAEISQTDSTKGAIEGVTDFGNNSYGGPCPPRGPAHRYFFKIYALDQALDLTRQAKKADIEKAMKGHILGMGQLMGKYQRK
jgi:Raf kinase inhibitor-like YbhB/YbcL family protein